MSEFLTQYYEFLLHFILQYLWISYYTKVYKLVRDKYEYRLYLLWKD